MPSYDYKCEDCKEEFEAVHSIKDKLTECPKCKSQNPPTRLISRTSFILAGGGWARDNYSK